MQSWAVPAWGLVAFVSQHDLLPPPLPSAVRAASGQEVPARPESGVGRGREQAKLDLQYDKAKLITSRL